MAEDAGLLAPLAVLPPSGDVGVQEEDVETAPRLLGGRSGCGGGGGTFRSSISAASFCSVALRSATRSAMRASRSLSSSSCRDSGRDEKNSHRSHKSTDANNAKHIRQMPLSAHS